VNLVKKRLLHILALLLLHSQWNWHRACGTYGGGMAGSCFGEDSG